MPEVGLLRGANAGGGGATANAGPKPMMRFIGNAEIDEMEAKAEAEKRQNSMVINSLSAHLRRHWEAARNARLPIEERMLDAQRQRNGEYRPEKMAQIREQGGSEVFMMLTNIKCRAAESWIKDILFPAGDKPWDIKPTPIPDLPDHVEDSIAQQVLADATQMTMQTGQVLTREQVEGRANEIKDELKKRVEDEAKKRCDRMEDRIEDQLVEGDWDKAVKEFIKDVVTFPAGILKGPIIRRKRRLRWGMRDGKWAPDVASELVPMFKRVSPYDLYPSPNSRGLDDGYLIERHRLRRSDLTSMRGVPGYDDEAINLVLDQYAVGGFRNWLFNDQIRANLEGRPNEYLSHDETIDALEYSGQIPGRLLREWGMTAEQVPDEFMDYECNCWMIGSFVIRAVLNDDPLGRRNYFKASFEELPGAFWGYGVPELMRDVQDICNAAARSLVNNMAIASGPQVELYTDRVAPGEDVTQMVPWKIWQMTDNPDGKNNRALQFHQPQSNAQVLMKVYDHFSKLADEYTGIPSYTYGDPTASGAGKTASGLSMLMTAASRGIKQVISHIDGPIEGTVLRCYEYNMLYDEDDSIKGDVRVQAKGSRSLIAKEQQALRRNEFMAMTANDVDMKIMGIEGRAALLREAVKSLEIDVSDVVPDAETINARMQSEMQATGAVPPEGAALDPAGNPAGGRDFAASAA